MKPVDKGGGGSSIWASIITGISELWSRVVTWWQGPTVPLAKDKTTPESQEVTKTNINERIVTSDTTTATHHRSEPSKTQAPAAAAVTAPQPRETQRQRPQTTETTTPHGASKAEKERHQKEKLGKDPLLPKLKTLAEELGDPRIATLLETHPEARESLKCILTILRFSPDEKRNKKYFDVLLSTKDIEGYHKHITKEVAKILSTQITNEIETAQSSRANDVFMSKEYSLSTDIARILSNIIINDNGDIDTVALETILQIRKNKEGNLTKTNSFIHNTHVTKMLNQLQGDLANNLSNITAPKNQNSESAMFVRMAVGKNINEKVTDTDAKRAVISCLLDELYQEDISDSCYTTSLAMNIRSEYPGLFIDDMKNIIDHGYYTRMIDGKPHRFFPMKKALDNNLENGVLKIGTIVQGEEVLVSIISPGDIPIETNDSALFSLINAFESAGINISPEEIMDIKDYINKTTKDIYIDNNGRRKSLKESEMAEFIKKAKNSEGSIMRTQEIPLKAIIKAVILKKVGLTSKQLSTLKRKSPEDKKYKDYLKLKNWVQQNFSNNQVNRLLRSWEYSIGTATLDTEQNQEITGNTFALIQIITLFDSGPFFKELHKKIPDHYDKFLNNFASLIENRIGVMYNKGIRVFFDKANPSGDDDRRKISSIQDLQNLVSSLVVEAGNSVLEDPSIKWKNNTQKSTLKTAITSMAQNVSGPRQKQEIIKVLQRETESNETDESTIFKQFLTYGSPEESLANYCGKTEPEKETVDIKPTTAKNLLLKLINSLKPLQSGVKTMPVGARTHAFSIVPGEGLFKQAIDSNLPAEEYLRRLAAGKTIVIADLNYMHNGKHVYLGVQKIGPEEYKIVKTLDTEKLYSGTPEILHESDAVIMESSYFLGTTWNITTTFNKDIENLQQKLIS